MSTCNPLLINPRIKPACKIDGCQSPVQGLTHMLCGKHWKRWTRNGDPMTARCTRRLAESEVRRLRRLIGLPEDGPTPAMKRAWTIEEAAA